MERIINTKFWTFNQNNSGGYFIKTDKIDCHVIIEAINEDDALERATNIGLYFDGWGDCECCGHRWSYPYDDGTEFPEKYGNKLEACEVKTDTIIHWFDGSYSYAIEID